jgi:hypothetical protein
VISTYQENLFCPKNRKKTSHGYNVLQKLANRTDSRSDKKLAGQQVVTSKQERTLNPVDIILCQIHAPSYLLFFCFFRQCTYNVVLRRVRVTIVAVEKQLVLSISCVCLYCYLSRAACKSHLFYAILYCHLWPVGLCHIFPHFLINSTVFGVKVTEIKTCILIFLYKFCLRQRFADRAP